MESVTNPNYFLQNRTLIAAVYSALKDAANNMLSKHGHMLVIVYIATAIIYCNTQRPGVVHNMSVEEFQRHQSVNGKILIQGMDHKTTSSVGPVNIVITFAQEEVMICYLQTIRWKVVP